MAIFNSYVKLPEGNVAIENGSFIDDLPVINGDFP